MAKLDPLSAEQMPESLDLFGCKPTLVGIKGCALTEWPTLHPITDGTIHFRLNTGLSFVDFSKSFITTKFRILKKEGEQFIPIKSTDPVSFIQGFGAAFIKHVKVSMNSRGVYDSNDLYAYNAYMK